MVILLTSAPYNSLTVVIRQRANYGKFVNYLDFASLVSDRPNAKLKSLPKIAT
ncbi:hypothetical protein H6G76_11815 [Nostoc sp. FACHB-152]|uniref:hypothetical protein n=1 Tax=unclassified Nostoc TaxID=2593658 RepID=UPI0016848AAC|nr:MULTISPECIES: hypothetical protein [unclassified Nostoc]MBD2447851.1 hypothetical protein [Nostoc sp. FACHB-152]MBD2468575.1 hypothetical protein [Nostoc sp. FACHB-145]